MGNQNTLGEMDEKVKEGLRTARESVGDETLLKLCDDLEYAWQHLCSNLIIVSVGLSAMRYRTAEQITEQLGQYLQTIQLAKKQPERMLFPNTTLAN